MRILIDWQSGPSAPARFVGPAWQDFPSSCDVNQKGVFLTVSRDVMSDLFRKKGRLLEILPAEGD